MRKILYIIMIVLLVSCTNNIQTEITVNKIDIYMESHSRANNFGRRTVTGRVIN